MAIEKPTPENSKYNRKKYVKNGKGNKAIQTMRDKYAKHKDKPTTAAADPSLRLPEALKQIDPQMISQVLPNMYNQLNLVKNMMKSFNSQSSSSSSPAGVSKKLITDVFTGALAELCHEHGNSETLAVFFSCLAESKYQLLGDDYKEIVFAALVALMQKMDTYGEDIPRSTIPAVTYESGIPTPLYSADEVPDYYIQQYYLTTNDPYPGYIEYLSPDNESIYVRRSSTDYPFETAEEEIRTLAEKAMAAELSPYIEEANLTVEILLAILIAYCESVVNQAVEKSNGKNSKLNLASLLTQFAGLAATLGKSTISNHIPQSVLDQTKITQTIEEHIQLIGKLKKMKAQSATAFNPQSLLNSNISSLLGSVLSGKANQITGNQQISNLITNVVKKIV